MKTRDELKCYRCGTFWRLKGCQWCLRCLHKYKRAGAAARQILMPWGQR